VIGRIKFDGCKPYKNHIQTQYEKYSSWNEHQRYNTKINPQNTEAFNAVKALNQPISKHMPYTWNADPTQTSAQLLL